MADDDDVFVYMGGDQRVPRDVTHARVHKSVKIITWRAFMNCRNMLSIEMHDGVEIIEDWAFGACTSLRGIKLTGARVIERCAFSDCIYLEDVEFGDKLEIIGDSSFYRCTSLRTIKIAKIRCIGNYAFYNTELTGVELSEDLETIGRGVFMDSPLRRIAIPLKDNLLDDHAFIDCNDLSQVDLVGGIHKTVSSLLLESWRNEMKDEIERINRDLPNTPGNNNNKTATTRQWMERVICRIDHYKSEHFTLLKEFTSLIELALWKAKLDEEFGGALSKEDNESNATKKANIDVKAARQERRITSGASIVIKNVLPFLKLE